MRRTLLEIMSTIVFVTLAACGARRPVVYPNDAAQQAGKAAVARDIEECMRRAEQAVSSGTAGVQAAREAAGGTAVGAATGAASGAAGGAFYGGAGRGAAAGAAAGATAGLMHGILRGFRSEPSPLFKNFVNRCLRERGYEPIGWE